MSQESAIEEELNDLREELSTTREMLAQALASLQMIADWPFDIQGDCVADARLVARKAVFGDPHKHAIDCSYRQLYCGHNCNCPRRHL